MFRQFNKQIVCIMKSRNDLIKTCLAPSLSTEKRGLMEMRAPTRRESGVSPDHRGLSSCPSSNTSALPLLLEEEEEEEAETLKPKIRLFVAFFSNGSWLKLLVMVKKLGFAVLSLKLKAIFSFLFLKLSSYFLFQLNCFPLLFLFSCGLN